MTQSASHDPKAVRAAAIKAAAIDVFAEHGYHAAKVSMIVKQVGVAQGTFYLYFKGKQELFGEILQDFLTLMSEPIAGWDVGKLERVDDYRTSLIELGDLLIPVFVSNRTLASIFFNEAMLVPEFAAQIQEFYDLLVSLLTGFNQKMCARGLIRDIDFEVAAIATIGMVERCIQQYIVNADTPLTNVQLKELTHQIVDLFIFGAAPR